MCEEEKQERRQRRVKKRVAMEYAGRSIGMTLDLLLVARSHPLYAQ